MSSEFKSGAQRSQKYPPFWKFPLVALQAWASRHGKGEKYERDNKEKRTLGVVHNWKLAIGKGDREYIQQAWNHAFYHLLQIKELCTDGVAHVDEEGESIFDHGGALMWNAAILVVYFVRDTTTFCQALNQEPFYYNDGLPVGLMVPTPRPDIHPGKDASTDFHQTHMLDKPISLQGNDSITLKPKFSILNTTRLQGGSVKYNPPRKPAKKKRR